MYEPWPRNTTRIFYKGFDHGSYDTENTDIYIERDNYALHTYMSFYMYTSMYVHIHIYIYICIHTYVDVGYLMAVEDDCRQPAGPSP